MSKLILMLASLAVVGLAGCAGATDGGESTGDEIVESPLGTDQLESEAELAQARVMVEFYDGAQFTGRYEGRDTTVCTNLGALNKKVSSIDLRFGRVRLWTGSNCTGRSAAFSRDIPDLALAFFDNVASSYEPY